MSTTLAMSNNLVALKARKRELGIQGMAVHQNKSLSNDVKLKRVQEISAELTRLDVQIETLKGFGKMAGGGELYNGPIPTPREGFGFKAPRLTLDAAESRRLFDAIRTKSTLRMEIETKAPTDSPSSLLPGQLLPGIVGLAHEPVRVLQNIPTGTMTSKHIDFIQHVSTTGAAATVAPGAPKPRVKFLTDKTELTARKIAAFTDLLDEDLADFPSFQEYVQVELTRVIQDAENAQILTGDGTGENLLGLLNQANILTRDFTADHTADDTVTGFDTIEMAIADLREGPAFTEPDTIVMHPTTWSKLRRLKDSLGRYLVAPDPTSGQARSMWDVPVLATTSCPVGTALVANLQEGASAFIRQGVTLEVSYQANYAPDSDETAAGQTGSAFTENKTLIRIEERLALGSQRPAALLKVTNL